MGPRVLVAYATSEGQTAHVAEFIAARLGGHGAFVQLADLRHESPSLEGFDGVLLGGSVHAGKFQKGLTDFIDDNCRGLNSMPSWFFATSLSEAIEAPPFGHENALRQIDAFLESTGWAPRASASVAGAVKYRDYSWPKRVVMRQVLAKSGGKTDTTRNWEYTNWDGVGTFVDDVAATVAAARPVAASVR